MAEIPYTILRLGEATGQGTNRQYFAEMKALAKYSPDNPYEIANEIMALRLGLLLGMPIPLGTTMKVEGEEDRLYYLSLQVRTTKEMLPPRHGGAHRGNP